MHNNAQFDMLMLSLFGSVDLAYLNIDLLRVIGRNNSDETVIVLVPRLMNLSLPAKFLHE